MKRFPSKRDAWLMGVLIAILGISSASLTASLLASDTDPGLGWVVSILIVAVLFVASSLRRTRTVFCATWWRRLRIWSCAAIT